MAQNQCLGVAVEIGRRDEFYGGPKAIRTRYANGRCCTFKLGRLESFLRVWYRFSSVESQ